MSTAPAPQLTFRAIVLSILLTVLLASANAYLGLFAGLTVATAIPAAVVSMAVLRLLGRPNILENNIVATGASAGSSIAAGAIFTIPALVLLGTWKTFDYWWVLAIVGLGGLLGVLFSVPLRRTLIIEQDLKFPEGIAAAEVLKAGNDPSHGVKGLSLAAGAAALFKLATSGLRAIPENFALSTYVGGKAPLYFGLNLSPALLGVGYVCGLNVGTVMLAGGVLAFWVLIPLYANVWMADHNPALAAQLVGLGAEEAAGTIRGAAIRYVGVGTMLAGGLWSLWTLRNSLVSGVRSGLAATRSAGGPVADTERDLPMNVILIGVVLFVLPLFALYHAIVGSFGVAATMSIIMIVAGFVFSSVSGYMAGLVGSSNNPVSGITICTILFASLVLLGLGVDSTVGPVAAIMIGAVTCTAAAVAGDNLQDLKAGRIVGATPWRQQVMLGIGAISSAAVMAPVLNLLLEAYGIGTPAHEGVRALPAPQANLMAAVAKGIFGGGLPWDMIGLGVIVGVVVIAVDVTLKARGAAWRAPVLAFAIGVYLPLELTTPIFVGGLVAELADRFFKRRNPNVDLESTRQAGFLFSAGLIAGEALIGVLIAIPIVATGNADVLAVPEGVRMNQWLGLAVVAAIAWWLYRSSIAAKPAPAAGAAH